MHVAAYAYQADLWCSNDIREAMATRANITLAETFTAEDTLDLAARVLGIDRTDADTDDFPAPVFFNQLNEESYDHCGQCGDCLAHDLSDCRSARAAEIGRAHGTNAASWVFSGNTPRQTYERWRKGIDEGDPEIMDAIPSPDFSSQWVDGDIVRRLLTEVTTRAIGDLSSMKDELVTAYEQAFAEAAQAEIERTISEQLD